MSENTSRDSRSPQRPKTAAQRASDANRIEQLAVRANTSRPSDRKSSDPQSSDLQGHAGPKPGPAKT